VSNVKRPGIGSSIVWFYYDGLTAAARFYGEILGLELVLDQGWAQIYRVSGGAFVGLVDGSSGKGHCRHTEESAVLLTLVVDDVEAWYSYLESEGVLVEGEINTIPTIDVQGFFLRDPGNYAIEIQKFTNPDTASDFRLTD